MENQNMENAKWYVLHTYSGYENVAKENLEQMALNYGLTNRIFDVVIPNDLNDKNEKLKAKIDEKIPLQPNGILLAYVGYYGSIYYHVPRLKQLQ